MQVFAVEDGTACGYYRIRLPFDEMAKQGLDMTYARSGDVPESADVVVGQRVGGRGQMAQWLRLWRDHKFVWETDDDLWTIDPWNVRAAQFFTPDLLSEVSRVASIAHLVTVSTEPLAEVMRKFNPNVVVLPNVIDDALLDVERPRRERLVVGWAGGDSHHTDLDYLAPLLTRFLRRNPAVELHTIGWGSQRSPQDFPAQLRQFVVPNPLHATGVPYRHTGWSNDIFGYYRSVDFDIGLAPLVPNTFNRSKSAIKAIEYAALGIPVIASDVGPYREYVVDGVTGFLVRRDHEWAARLRDLVEDEAMRSEMGAKAKEQAREWTVSRRWKAWADAYRSLA